MGVCCVHVVHCIPHYMCISCISESEKEQRGGTERERERKGWGREGEERWTVSFKASNLYFVLFRLYRNFNIGTFSWCLVY